MNKTPKPGPEQRDLARPSTYMGGPNEGEWVLVAALATRHDGTHGVPVMGEGQPTMRRYGTIEMAVAGSVDDSAMRRANGWALNLRTGETVRVKAMR